MNESTEMTTAYGPARVLLGWMDEQEALRIQHQCRGDVEISSDAIERFRIARERVAARPSGVDQRDLLRPLPEKLEPYVRELGNHPALEETFAEGWTASLIDLRRVCAFQSRVFTDHADERVRALDPDDVASIASVSLPIPNVTSLPAFFDPTREAWVITSPDPNLKVLGNFARKITPDVAGFGFSIGVGRSFVAAMNYRGRYYLTDGYHRSVAFLRRGITHVPGLVRTLRDDEPFKVPTSMLPASSYLGDRPPQLADFLEKDVSLSLVMPTFRRVILIQAISVMA